ncbi:2-Hydroxyacid oxidase 1-like [Amblyomma americanum]
MSGRSTSTTATKVPEALARTVEDVERMGLARLEPVPRVYFTMGEDREQTASENKLAFTRLRLLPRLLRGVACRSLETTVLGEPITMPVGISPAPFHRMAHPDGELATARAVEAAGTVMILSMFSTTSLEDVRDAAPKALLWFQVFIHPNRSATQKLVLRAQNAGYRALVCTVDAPVGGTKSGTFGEFLKEYSDKLRAANFSDNEVQSGGKSLAQQFLDPGMTWEDIAWLKSISTVPIVVKGVVTAEAAIQAVEHGASAILVSNHGGRQLDGVPATIDVLPDIVRAVGHRCEVYLDGGIRLGTDVIKALALGARAVFVGRPAIFGLAYDGLAGVSKVLEILRSEVDRAMALMGCRTISELHAGMVVRQERFARL